MKYEHASVSFASARSAALPMCPAAWSLPHDSNGMTARESTARTMPTALSSGARRVHNVTLAWATTYNASSSNVTPTNRCTRRSVRAMCNASAPRTSTVSLQSMSAAAAISITLSSPKPRRATLWATAPAQSATTASMTLYAIVPATSPTAILTHTLPQAGVRWRRLESASRESGRQGVLGGAQRSGVDSQPTTRYDPRVIANGL